MTNCMYCGNTHQGVCARVKSIEYADDGVTVLRVEFHAPQWPYSYLPIGPQPQINPTVSYGRPVYGPALSNGTGD